MPRIRFPLALASALSAAALLAPLAVAPIPEAHASVMITLTLQELVEKSDSVVVGLPKSKVSQWEGGRIVTFTTIAVDTAIAGAAKAGDTIVVRTLGGAVGDIGQIAHGEAVIPLDKPIMLFLRPSLATTKVLSVVGMSQGAMALHVDESKIVRITPRPMDLVLMPKAADPKAVPASTTLTGKALPDAIKDIRAIWAARAKK